MGEQIKKVGVPMSEGWVIEHKDGHTAIWHNGKSVLARAVEIKHSVDEIATIKLEVFLRNEDKVYWEVKSYEEKTLEILKDLPFCHAKRESDE